MSHDLGTGYPETWEAFLAQPPETEWGHLLQVSTQAKADMARVAFGKLTDATARGAWQRGYQLRPESFRVFWEMRGSTDPLSERWSQLGIKGYGDLHPEPRAFIVWAETIVAEHRQQTAWIAARVASLETWRGFLRYQRDSARRRLLAWWRPDDDEDA